MGAGALERGLPMRELDAAEAVVLLADALLHLIRRGADGSLVMSADRWRCAGLEDGVVRFVAQPPAPATVAPLMIDLAEVERISWDRLARQQSRSQVRFHLRSGDLLTFSGRLPAPP